MAYYHDLITEKSWEKLQELKRSYNFVLIGGWAVYLYTHGLKSRDIDFICDYQELERLKASYQLIKNERLKKYEIHAGEFDVDIYVPYFSDLGIPVEELMEETANREGFLVLTPEALMFLKQKAFQDRQGSAKGEKDKIDILALSFTDFSVAHYFELATKYRLQNYPPHLMKILHETRHVPELGIGEHAFSKSKKNLMGQLAAFPTQ